MSDIVIRVEDVSKMYRLGTFGGGTLVSDVNRFIAKVRGKEDPYKLVGINDRTLKADSEYVWSLKDINFEIKQGDAVGIVGKNGAGKSTLLKILSRITAPTSGSVKIKGRVASLLEVGTGFHPDLSGRDNIYMNGAILGMSRTEIKKRFDEIVDFAGVEKYIDTPVKRYSSGMYVRLAFAVAAYLEPEILIVDEVLAVGDAEFQKKCLGKMQDVNSKDGRTVLFVSHNMMAIQTLCKSALLLHNGQVESFGDVPDILKNYQSLTAELISLDIATRKDRTGNLELKFTHVDLCDSEYNTISKAFVGQSVLFKIYYVKNISSDLKNVCFSMAIKNDIGLQLTDLSSESSNIDTFHLQHTEGFFEVRIPRLNISSGYYTVNLFATSNNSICDWVIDAYQFEVEPGDYYGTGKNQDRKQNLFFTDYTVSNINQ